MLTGHLGHAVSSLKVEDLIPSSTLSHSFLLLHMLQVADDNSSIWTFAICFGFGLAISFMWRIDQQIVILSLLLK